MVGSLPRGLQWVHWWPHIPAEQKMPRGEGASALEVSDGLRHVQWTCHSGTRGAHGGTFPHTVAPSRDRLRVMVAASGARQGQWEAAGHCEPGLRAQQADEQSAASWGLPLPAVHRPGRETDTATDEAASFLTLQRRPYTGGR